MGPTTPLLEGLRDRTTAVRRAVLRRRRLLAVLCTVAAVAFGVRAVAPPAPDTVSVVVADEELAAGAVLRPADLRTVEVPPAAAPAEPAVEPVGATLAGPVGAGEPITARRVVGGDLTVAGSGATAVPVRLGDAAQADLLRVGMRIDLLATDPKTGATETVATGVTVLGTPADGASRAEPTPGRVVVLGIAHEAVRRVTGATVSSYVTFAWAPV